MSGTDAATPALQDGRQSLSAAALDAAVHALAERLRAAGSRVVATLLDNGVPWVVADRAAARAGVVHVPLPLFFTPAQIAHTLAAAGVDTLLAAPQAARALDAVGPSETWPVHADTVVAFRRAGAAVMLPAGTAKITFTSGTTGAPKGVCLSHAAMQAVADGLAQALAPLQIGRHLCALPLPVLLENIAGVMAPLSQGATVVVPPVAEVGLQGSSSFDPARLDAAVRAHAPHSLILLPQMLRAWLGHLRATGQAAPPSLKIVAAGGAAVGPGLLAAAQAAGLPVCEGYGLSEGASVQTLNRPGAQQPGSAGQVLPHARLRIAPDGEVLVAGSLFSGYLGDPRPVPEWWPSGDLGEIDADGHLRLRGRKSQVLITAFGRNVSPEWVETALRETPVIGQAVVLGEGEPALVAVLWPAAPQVTDTMLADAVAAANATLPDYARVARWTRGAAPFDAASGLATVNGRPRRDAIARAHGEALGLAPFPETLVTP